MILLKLVLTVQLCIYVLRYTHVYTKWERAITEYVCTGCVCPRVYLHIYIYMHTYIHIHTYMCVCACVRHVSTEKKEWELFTICTKNYPKSKCGYLKIEWIGTIINNLL